MKKIFLILLITFLFIPGYSFAQTQAPVDENSETTSNGEIDIKVDQIKDKVASRVAELNLVEKRGMVGVVESVTKEEIRISDLNDKTRIILVDELTKFSSDNGSFEITDIESGTKISAIGLYNKDSGRLLARFINEISIPLFLNGVITDKDDKNFTITLLTEGEKEYTVDVENITKSFSFNDGELENSGFAKIPLLKNALIIGYESPNSENRITAGRIIIFPDLPRNPRIEVGEISQTPTKTTSPSPKDEQ